MLVIYGDSVAIFDVGNQQGSIDLQAAKAGLSAASTDDEKNDWGYWVGMIQTEYDFYKNVSNDLHVKQDALKAEYSQLEASIVANCGGLGGPAPQVTDVSSL